MSVRAMTWVWSLQMNASHKLVMLALADHADDKGKCWPGLDGIASKCGMTRRNLIRVIQKLEQAGFLKKEARRENGHQGSNIYHLNIDGMGLPDLSEVLSPCAKTLSDKMSPSQDDKMSLSQGDISAKQGDIAVSPESSLTTTINKDKVHIPDSDESGAQEDFYLTKKKRKLTGRRLAAFELFWKTFNFAKGKAEAADAWYELPPMKNDLFQQILRAAEQEAKRRPAIIAEGRTPKWAQGWISGRRWEDGADLETIAAKDDPLAAYAGRMIKK